VVGGSALADDRRVARALTRSMVLERLESDSLAVAEAYIPTEYILIGPFLRTPTPNKLRPFRSGEKLIPVALSTMAP